MRDETLEISVCGRRLPPVNNTTATGCWPRARAQACGPGGHRNAATTLPRAITTDATRYTISGTGYAPEGEIRRDGAPAPVSPDLRRLALGVLLCNDADLIAPGERRPEWAAAGDPMEAALVAFAARCGLDPSRERAALPRVAEHPFDQASRRMTTVHRRAGGDFLVVCKGAPEAVLPRCRESATAESVVTQMAQRGLRVLAVASRTVDAAQVAAGAEMLRPATTALLSSKIGAPMQDAPSSFSLSSEA